MNFNKVYIINDLNILYEKTGDYSFCSYLFKLLCNC